MCARVRVGVCEWTTTLLVGGFDGDAHMMDVCILETDRLTWSCPSTTGMQPPPREGHAASMIGKYLFIAGGCDGGAARFF